MPNTLAHFGIQTLGSKAIYSGADLRWIAVGCVIPDLPWITQRMVTFLLPAVDLISLRVYCMIQASLLCCLILSLAISLLCQKPVKVFLILAGNCLAHLLFDAMQIKWANGVHLLAPLSWQMTQFHLFWPESRVTSILTILGLGTIIYFGWHERAMLVEMRRSPKTTLFAVLLLTLYILLPLAFYSGPYSSDNHFVKTLRETDARAGKPIGFDRCHYDAADGSIVIFTKERLKLLTDKRLQTGTISLYGSFADEHSVRASSIHQHGFARDHYSLAGLIMLALLWIVALFQKRIRIR